METINKLDSIKEHAINGLENLKGGCSVHGCDLHNELFNTDYFIIGTYQAKKWLGDEVFDCIEKIKEYEQDNFGQVSTDLSDPEKVVNMYAYILGEEILSDSETLRKAWDRVLDDDDLKAISEEIA